MTCVSSPLPFQVSGHSRAPTATGPSLTAPTCGLICRPTPRWRSTSVASALAPSAACLCCRNTAPQGAAPPGFETPQRQTEGTHSEFRAVEGLVVHGSPTGLLTTCKATKSMAWPALRDLEGIEPHYWIWQAFLPSLLCDKKNPRSIFFFFQSRLRFWGWTKSEQSNADIHLISAPLLLLCPFKWPNM